ncbi:MAG: MFS transporter [Chloroflexota bacterium]
MQASARPTPTLIFPRIRANPWIVLLVLVAAILLVPEVRSQRSHDLDLAGVALASSGLFSLVYALVESKRYSWGPINSFGAFSMGPTRWSAVSVYSLLVYAVLLLTLFVLWEMRAREPLLPLSLFGDRNFSVTNLVGAAVGIAMGGMFLPITIFLQSVLGMSAVHAGLTLVPMSIALLAGSPLAGRLTDVVNGEYLIMAGLTCAAIGVGLLEHALGLADTTWSFVIPLAVTGLGFGFVFAPMITLAMRDVPPSRSGAASGFLTTDRQVAMAVGSAVIGSVLANRFAEELPKQAAGVAAQVPLGYRGHFVSAFQTASHGSQNFGAGQSTGGSLPAHASQAAAQHLATLGHEVFSQAFLNAARPSLAVAVVALIAGALFTTLLRGGRSAADARQEQEPVEEALAG